MKGQPLMKGKSFRQWRRTKRKNKQSSEIPGRLYFYLREDNSGAGEDRSLFMFKRREIYTSYYIYIKGNNNFFPYESQEPITTHIIYAE